MSAVKRKQNELSLGDKFEEVNLLDAKTLKHRKAPMRMYGFTTFQNVVIDNGQRVDQYCASAYYKSAFITQRRFGLKTKVNKNTFDVHISGNFNDTLIK